METIKEKLEREKSETTILSLIRKAKKKGVIPYSEIEKMEEDFALEEERKYAWYVLNFKDRNNID